MKTSLVLLNIDQAKDLNTLISVLSIGFITMTALVILNLIKVYK